VFQEGNDQKISPIPVEGAFGFFPAPAFSDVPPDSNTLRAIVEKIDG
jgi:hypothetical protein